MATPIQYRVLRRVRPTALAAACAEHLRHLADRHYAETTRAVRRVHLRLFCAWAVAQGVTELGALTQPAFEAYRCHLTEYRKANGVPLSVASQHARLTYLRVWCAWLTRA